MGHRTALASSSTLKPASACSFPSALAASRARPGNHRLPFEAFYRKLEVLIAFQGCYWGPSGGVLWWLSGPEFSFQAKSLRSRPRSSNRRAEVQGV